ncbi:hypothetical protein LHGZ1_0788 [Laribacter hongkongensis]|uniref:Uncharacterized protein n=1 Tax=Laribacter hongkongensis TaxID=168471 RepID=A0A248LGN1_9NEIS|nr:hypothetical protein LHGZ1_0788 [Laribacter hongkongensis]
MIRLAPIPNPSAIGIQLMVSPFSVRLVMDIPYWLDQYEVKLIIFNNH